MCNGNKNERTKEDWLRCTVKILSGQSLEQVAEEEGLPIEHLKSAIKSLEKTRPELYEKLKQKL
jgi:putative SOS response-associated peptidase YedK